MSNYQRGHDAEKDAARYLKARDFKIIDLNWKTSSCEIDIVASKKEVIYLIEVKYRKDSRHGFGLDYITKKKLKQMMFAAEMWAQQNDYDGQYQLAAIGIDGNNITLVEIT